MGGHQRVLGMAAGLALALLLLVALAAATGSTLEDPADRRHGDDVAVDGGRREDLDWERRLDEYHGRHGEEEREQRREREERERERAQERHERHRHQRRRRDYGDGDDGDEEEEVTLAGREERYREREARREQDEPEERHSHRHRRDSDDEDVRYGQEGEREHAEERRRHRERERQREREREAEEEDRERLSHSRHREHRDDDPPQPQPEPQPQPAQQPDLQLPAPQQVFTSPGGAIHVWDTTTTTGALLATAGGAATWEAARVDLHCRGLLLPQYADSGSVAYVEQGEGLMGLVTGTSLGETVRRVRAGDVVAIPPGVAQWWYNSADDSDNQDADLRIIALSDTSTATSAALHPGSGASTGAGNGSTGLGTASPKYTTFALAGGPAAATTTEAQQRPEDHQQRSVLHGLPAEFLAQAWNVPETAVTELLAAQPGHGIVTADHLSTLTTSASDNVLSEFVYNVRGNTPDVSVPGAGHFAAVSKTKLPALSAVGLGLTHVRLEPHALLAPHWSPGGHQVVHVLRGAARVHVAGSGGRALLSKQVKAGDAVVVPRFHVVGAQAGAAGVEWVSFCTTDEPRVEALAGKTSVLGNVPEGVAAAAFGVGEDQVAELLRRHRLREALIFPGEQGEEQRQRQREQRERAGGRRDDH